MDNTREKLKEPKNIKVTSYCIQARIQWKDKGNAMNKEFFFVIKVCSTTSFIMALKDQDGNILTDYKDVEATCYEFNQTLYKAPTPTHQIEQTREKIIKQIPTKFTNGMNEVVQMLITKPKILKVAKVMAQMRW